MSSFDVNNNFIGNYYGTDRKGHTTPDPDGSEVLRPFLPVPYPAPWLPARRRDEGHPVGASIVLSAGYAVGLDKSGALIPAGLKSGSTGTLASGAGYCLLKYGSDDIGWTVNPKTGAKVLAASSLLIACPSDAQEGASGLTLTIDVPGAGKVFTVASGSAGDKAKVAVGQTISVAGLADPLTIAAVAADVSTITVAEVVPNDVTGAAMTYVAPVVDGVTLTAADLAWAKTCDLIPGGTARAIGYAIRNVFQYIGGTKVSSTTKGIEYVLNGMQPAGFVINNYMHEPGTAIQTSMVLRVPWIGKDLAQLEAAATTAGLSVPTEYNFPDYSKSFVHFSGDLGAGAGKLFRGCAVVASDAHSDSGNYRPFNSAKDNADQVIGRVIGIENMYPIRDYADRVRTQFDRAQSFQGPFMDKNPQTFMMGGSATRGADYAIALGTNNLLRALLSKGAAVPAEAATYVWFGLRTI